MRSNTRVGRVIDQIFLERTVGGISWENFRLSENVEDRRGETTPLEDGGFYEHSTGQVLAEEPNQSLGGYRDDPNNGDRTWIGADGNSVAVQHHDGTYSPPGTPVEDGLYDPSTNQTIPDPSANQTLGGYRDDPNTGNRAIIDGEGQTTGVQRADGQTVDQYTPTEDGLYDNLSNQHVDDFTANQNGGGYRDDQETGDRTTIDQDGETLGTQREDGSFASPHTPVEDGLYNHETGQVDPDFTANQNLGGYREDPETGGVTEIDGRGNDVEPQGPGITQQDMQELSDLSQMQGPEQSAEPSPEE